MQSTNPAKTTEEKKRQTWRQKEAAFLAKAPVAIAGLIGVVFGGFVIFRFEEDTTPITNAAFAIMATLAALSFSFARVVDTSELRDRIMFAGERLLHGAVFVLIASILRYFVFLLYKIPIFVHWPMLKLPVSLAFGLFGGPLFF